MYPVLSDPDNRIKIFLIQEIRRHLFYDDTDSKTAAVNKAETAFVNDLPMIFLLRFPYLSRHYFYTVCKELQPQNKRLRNPEAPVLYRLRILYYVFYTGVSDESSFTSYLISSPSSFWPFQVTSVQPLKCKAGDGTWWMLLSWKLTLLHHIKYTPPLVHS